MKELKLKATTRGTGKKGLFELGDATVPGVVYGREVKSTPVATDRVTLTKLFNEAGSNRIVGLDIDGKTQDVLFKEVQFDPVTSDIRHFDLYAIVKGEKIKAEVPVNAIGDSPAVVKGAQLAVNVEMVEVECIPSKLPDHFELDISSIEEIGDTLHIYDIVVDDDVTILDDPETTVFKAEEIREMVIEDETPEEVEGEEGEEGDETEEGGEEGEQGDGESEETSESKE